MKNFIPAIVLICLTALCFGVIKCTKEIEQMPKVYSEKMTAAAAKIKLGYEIPGIDYSNDASARNGKPKANQAEVIVWFNDLPIDSAGGLLTGQTSPNAKNAAMQKFIDSSTTAGASALFDCQRWYTEPPGVVPVSCANQGAAYYRFITSDFDYSVHTSAFLRIN